MIKFTHLQDWETKSVQNLLERLISVFTKN